MTTREQAGAAARRRDWQAAYDAYAVLPDLVAADLEALAEAAWWLGRMEESISRYAEAYRRHLDERNDCGAGRTAFLLAIHTRLVGEAVQSAGWLNRAQRLLDEVAECAEQGYVLYLRIAGRMGGGDLDGAFTDARRMQDLGRRFGDPTLAALGVYFEGRVRVKQARVPEGLALLDEAMVAALSDELSLFWTGAIYCGLMDACNELRDLRRASEWTEATRRWCDPLPLASLYPGICRVHHAQLLQVRGAWEQAEREALSACRDMVGIDVFAVADAYYEVGEVRRLRGDLAGAEAAYSYAHEHGRDPQPGLALLRLAQGKGEAASASIAAARAAAAGSRMERAGLRAAEVEIALSAGDVALAEAAADEVAATAEAHHSDGLRAVAHRCLGAVRLAQGRAVEAMGLLRMAFLHWQALDVPYEAARTRMLLAEGYRALGDADAADREAAAAQICFDRLGVRNGGTTVPAGLTPREVEVVRLIAAGKTNRGIATELVLSEKTVARHLSNIFAKVGATSRAGVAAFGYDSGLLGRNTHR
jgi:DNA-binding CsgD family transcriptional regulator/tetratricopeptide (TPR) repeat protein